MKFTVKTQGHYDFIDITDHVADAVDRSGIKAGLALIFVAGSTAAIITMEYEQGVKQDIINVLEGWAPEKAEYEHHKKWGDSNGAAHIKSAILGTDQTVPVEDGHLQLGTWQQIVLVDFDEKPRNREIIVQIVSNFYK